MKSLFLILFTTIIFIQSNFAQEFNWKDSEPIENNRYQHIIGKNDKFIFVLFSKFPIKTEGFQTNSMTKFDNVSLVKFDAATYKLISSVPFQLKKKPQRFYDVYINDQGFFIIYTDLGIEQISCYADHYSNEGAFMETVLLHTYNSEMKDDFFDPFGCVASENKRFLLLYTKKNMVLFDKTLKSIWQKQVDQPNYKDLLLLNNGVLYELEKKDNITQLIKFDQTGKTTITKINYQQLSPADFKIKFNDRDQELVVAATYGINLKDVQDIQLPDPKFRTQGVFLTSFDLELLTEKKSLKIAFSNDILNKVSGKRNIKGLEDIWMFDLIFPSTGGMITLVQSQYSGYSTTASGTTRPSYYRDMILLKTDKEGVTIQKNLQKGTLGDFTYEHILSAATFYVNDKLYILYNEGSIRYTLKIATYDANLELLSQTELLTYKEHKIYLALRNYLKIAENTYYISGREGRFSGSTVLSFK